MMLKGGIVLLAATLWIVTIAVSVIQLGSIFVK